MAENAEGRQYVVNGYQFENAMDYEDAVNEKKGIKYLEEHVNLNDAAELTRMYNTLLEKNMFRTPIGLEYMRKLRAAILRTPGLKERPPFVRVPACSGTVQEQDGGGPAASAALTGRSVEDGADSRIKELEARVRKYKDGRRNSVIINIILAIAIIAMLVIAGTSSAPNVINYERVITDKYSSWKQELTDKEKELRQWEKELEQRESEADSR